MTKFILVRHGETEWNRNERFRGRADLSLNENGLKQAEAAALKLSGGEVAAIYSSPMKRTLETADPISRELGVAVSPTMGLIDIDYGEWQGLSPEEAIEKDAAMHDKWLSSPHEVLFPGGEGLGDVRERAEGAVHEIAAKHDGQTVILVSHKVVCQVLLCAMLSLDNSHFWQVRQDVCAINRFQVADGFTSVRSVNDVCHLKNLAAR
ncbi:MAG: histidine phosphatase family protein [Dehalococcoidia bacterium]